MYALVVNSMRETTIEVKSIRKLISATTDFGHSTHVVERQVVRTQERLNRGVDVFGNKFAPFKDDRVRRNSRPLQRAARLFEGPRFDLVQTLTGQEFVATISGQAAKIANYQNVNRKFVGFSRQDRSEIREDLKFMIGNAFKNWRRH